MHYLGLDIGTTCCKGQVFDHNGEIIFYEIEELSLIEKEKFLYVDIVKIWEVIRKIISSASQKVDLDAICIASFGESFVLLDDKDELLTYPMLYIDPRGEKEAKEVAKKFSDEKIFKITGTIPHAMYSIYKLLYIKNSDVETYKRAKKMMLICDYIGYLLTGERVIDYALACRTGAFDIEIKEFSKELLEALDIDLSLLSTPKMIGSEVGYIKKDIAQELGVSKKCKLILGSHDQILATIGAGILKNKEAAAGMGTVECITAIMDKPFSDINLGRLGFNNIPFIDGLYCTYIVNYSAGSVVTWYKDKILHKYCGDKEDFFSYMDQYLEEKPVDVLCLPYLSGNAILHNDSNASGAFINIKLTTTDAEIYQSILESTCYDVKQSFEYLAPYGLYIKDLIASGGGSKSKFWLQIKSDILDVKIKSLASKEGGLLGAGIIACSSLGKEDIETVKNRFVHYKDTFVPHKQHQEEFLNKYQKYKKLYKSLKEVN